MYTEVIRPCARSGPTGMIVEATDAAPLVTKCIGFQSSSKTFRIACAANFAVTPEIRTSALLERSVTICESMVGSVTS